MDYTELFFKLYWALKETWRCKQISPNGRGFTMKAKSGLIVWLEPDRLKLLVMERANPKRMEFSVAILSHLGPTIGLGFRTEKEMWAPILKHPKNCVGLFPVYSVKRGVLGNKWKQEDVKVGLTSGNGSDWAPGLGMSSTYKGH